MGLLNNYLTKTIPKNARNIWDAMKRAPSDLQALGSPQMASQVRQAMNKPATLDRNAAMGMAMDYLQTTNPMGGLLAHTVYHGSPHKFNKFDMSKIGTGEGAQAYGHGLYFAESPGVAKWYGDKLSVGEDYVDGQLLDTFNPRHYLARALADSSGDKAATEEFLQTMMLPGGAKSVRQTATEALDLLKKGDMPTLQNIKPEGQLYKVDIPDESIPKMLDWDKPLSEQSEFVRQALEKLGYTHNAQDAAAFDDALLAALDGSGAGNLPKMPRNPMGSDIARGQGLFDGPAQIAKAKALRDAGIPGIRYKDAISRGTDAGTSNFVLFNDELARILEINGQPTGLLSWADEAKKVKK